MARLKAAAREALLTFKLPGQEVPEPALQQRRNPSHEEEPHAPAGSPEAAAGALPHRPLHKGRKRPVGFMGTSGHGLAPKSPRDCLERNGPT